MASSKITIKNTKGIPKQLLCPICSNIPGKVFQCRKGHVMCPSCYFQLVECPTCGKVLSKRKPIRCRFFEDLLKNIEVSCPFKSNGCEESIARKVLQDHKAKCCYNFEKFGKLVNICKVFGYPNCPFRVNNARGNEAVDHFRLLHNVPYLQDDGFIIKHADFLNKLDSDLDYFRNHSPFILDLIEKQVFILIKQVYNKTHAKLDFLSVFLPYSNSITEEPLQSPVLLKFSMWDEKEKDSLKLDFLQEPVSIQTVATLRQKKLPGRISLCSLTQCLSKSGSLLIVVEPRSNKGCNARIQSPEQVPIEEHPASTSFQGSFINQEQPMLENGQKRE